MDSKIGPKRLLRLMSKNLIVPVNIVVLLNRFRGLLPLGAGGFSFVGTFRCFVVSPTGTLIVITSSLPSFHFLVGVALYSPNLEDNDFNGFFALEPAAGLVPSGRLSRRSLASFGGSLTPGSRFLSTNKSRRSLNKLNSIQITKSKGISKDYMKKFRVLCRITMNEKCANTTKTH